MKESQERVSISFEIGPKGRSVLPAAVRRAAGVSVKDKLTAYSDGPGRIVLETPAAIQARVWAGAGEGLASDTGDDTRAFRQQEISIADSNFDRRSVEPNEGAANTAGQRLLDKLGL
jgi:bifunctional DNA-binding transcriptional regulator/antitoxin component of YhaV-PrlF toxin-antitoxin module